MTSQSIAKRSFQCVLSGFLLLGAVGCPSESPKAVLETKGHIATVDDVEIAPEHLSFPAGERGFDARRDRLDAAIMSTVAATEARRRGLAEDTDVQLEIARIRADAVRLERELLQNALYQAVRKGVEISENDVQAHYATTKRRYAKRQVTINRSVYASRNSASAARLGNEAGRDPVEVEILGPMPLAKLPASVLPEAARLVRAGDVELAEGDDGRWSVIELVALEPSRPLALEDVRERVEESIRVRKGGAAWNMLLNELRAGADIQIDEKMLKDESFWQLPPVSGPVSASQHRNAERSSATGSSRE